MTAVKHANLWLSCEVQSAVRLKGAVIKLSESDMAKYGNYGRLHSIEIGYKYLPFCPWVPWVRPCESKHPLTLINYLFLL